MMRKTPASNPAMPPHRAGQPGYSVCILADKSTTIEIQYALDKISCPLRALNI